MKKQIYFEDIDFSSEVFDKVSVKLIKELTLIPYKETNDSVFILKTEDSKIINDTTARDAISCVKRLQPGGFCYGHRVCMNTKRAVTEVMALSVK